MKAVILAGGRGKRLRPITDYVPKPMVPINNTPLIEWQIRYLQSNQINDIIICTGYKSEIIQDFIDKKYPKKIKISIEEKPLGTAGAIKKIAPLIEEDFFVLNGDVLTNINLKRLEPNSIASIPLQTKFGILDIHGKKISNFREKNEISGIWMNAGIYCLKRDIFADLPVKGDLERTIFPNYAKHDMLSVVKFDDVIWYSIDSFKDIEECSANMDRLCAGSM